MALPDTHAAVEAFMKDYERLTILHDAEPWSEFISMKVPRPRGLLA